MLRFYVARFHGAILLTLALLCFTGVIEAFAQPNERTRKVLEDKEKITKEGFWIYNDLEAGFENAKQSGKPILVVLRCLPCEECVKLDDELVDQDPVIRSLLEQFVCVRVVSTNGLDLSLFQFDTDQSFAAFMLRDRETIYGRFGTRSHRTDWIGDVSINGFAEALRGALDLHTNWPRDKAAIAGKLGPVPAVTRPELFASLMEKHEYTSKLNYEGDVVRSCIHCHQIGDAIRDEYRERNESIPESVLFPFPHPKSIGIVFDPSTKGTIQSVVPSSPASVAGFRSGDHVIQVSGQPILSIADIQWVLHGTPPDGAEVTVAIQRDGKMQSLSLALEEGWRRASDLSWRASTWGLRRMATGGMRIEPLSVEDRAALNVASNELALDLTDMSVMALKVKGVGMYGPHAAAKNAGFMQDDVILSIDGRTDFRSEDDVIRYGVTDKKAGDEIAITILRNGKTRTLHLPMQK